MLLGKNQACCIPGVDSSLLGTLATYKPGELVGGAYEASYILCKVEDVQGEYAAEEDVFVAGLEFIEPNGGDVATSSVVMFVGYNQEDVDGQTADGRVKPEVLTRGPRPGL